MCFYSYKKDASETIVGKLLMKVFYVLYVPYFSVSILYSLNKFYVDGMAHLIEHWASNQKLQNLDLIPDALCPWEKHLMLFPILGPAVSFKKTVEVVQPDERHANRTAFVLEWYDRYRAYEIWFKEE